MKPFFLEHYGDVTSTLCPALKHCGSGLTLSHFVDEGIIGYVLENYALRQAFPLP